MRPTVVTFLFLFLLLTVNRMLWPGWGVAPKRRAPIPETRTLNPKVLRLMPKP